MPLTNDSWHEQRLLIDGELVGAEGGATYDNINPANEEVIGKSADASKGDLQRAIDAGRRAFDQTEWSRDVGLRARCLRQLHQALIDHYDDFADITVAEVGAPRMLIGGPQLGEPLKFLPFYADLARGYEWIRQLGVAPTMAGSAIGGSSVRRSAWSRRSRRGITPTRSTSPS